MKRFGIRVSIDGDSTWRAPHLLGESWESFRWFDTRSERDRVFEDMSSPLENYRRGDIPRQVLERVER